MPLNSKVNVTDESTIDLNSVPIREIVAAANALQQNHGSYAYATPFLGRLLTELSAAGLVELRYPPAPDRQ